MKAIGPFLSQLRSGRLHHMDARARQVARNESLFREVNERIEEIAETMFKSSHSGFFCECGDDD